MIPINNSDLAWLITSDFNQDNNIGFPEELRQDIISPNVNDWHHEEDRLNNDMGPMLGEVVGDLAGNFPTVGFGNLELPEGVGDYVPRRVWVIAAPISKYVGGHRDFQL